MVCKVFTRSSPQVPTNFAHVDGLPHQPNEPRHRKSGTNEPNEPIGSGKLMFKHLKTPGPGLSRQQADPISDLVPATSGPSTIPGSRPRRDRDARRRLASRLGSSRGLSAERGGDLLG